MNRSLRRRLGGYNSARHANPRAAPTVIEGDRAPQQRSIPRFYSFESGQVPPKLSTSIAAKNRVYPT